MTENNEPGEFRVEDIEACPLEIKTLIQNLTKTIKEQAKRINELENRQNMMEDNVIQNRNQLHDLEERTATLERYSRKTCLIFANIEVEPNPIDNILQLLRNCLQININAQDIAACHPLNRTLVAPVIVKFIYHEHRDLCWRRKSWLKGVQNTMGKPIIIEECLGPVESAIKKEARLKNVKVITRHQEVYAYHPKNPDQEPVKIKKVSELNDFGDKPQNFESYQSNPRYQSIPVFNQSNPVFNQSNPVFNLPQLTRKPTTPITPMLPRRNSKRGLSPIMEVNQDNNSLATKLADAVIPALLSALGATARERKIRKESEIDDEVDDIFDDADNNFRNDSHSKSK